MSATLGPWMVEPINDGDGYQITTCHSTGFAVLAETHLKVDAYRLAASPDLTAVREAGHSYLTKLVKLSFCTLKENFND